MCKSLFILSSQIYIQCQGMLLKIVKRASEYEFSLCFEILGISDKT
jgi:hypothetical protein